MQRIEAEKIISGYDKDWFNIRIEDSMFGDGSHSISFEVLFDSYNEAEKVAEAIQVILTGKKQKICKE